MGHISFPWSYIFWRSTSLGLPCKSNPTPTTKIKIATFTTSILAEGTEHVVPVEKISSKKPEKKHSKRHQCCAAHFTKHNTIGLSHGFIEVVPKKVFPDSTWKSSFIRRSISNPHVSCSSSSTYRPQQISSCAWVNPWVKRVHLLQSFGMKMPKLFET